MASKKLREFEIKLRLPFVIKICNEEIRFKMINYIFNNYKNGEIKIDEWIFPFSYALIYLQENKKWLNEYVPPNGLKDKVVLDIGAGAGESAKFFLDQGSKKVICIEPYEYAFNYLIKNSQKYNLEIIKKEFDPKMLLEIEHDFCKIDIEGYEELLFDNKVLINYKKPIAIEAHHLYAKNKLRELGFNINYNELINPKFDQQWRGGSFVMQRFYL